MMEFSEMPNFVVLVWEKCKKCTRLCEDYTCCIGDDTGGKTRTDLAGLC